MVREVSPPLREGQGVKLCSLLSKSLSYLLPCRSSLGTARGPEAGGGPEREGGGTFFPLCSWRIRASLAGAVAPWRPPGPRPLARWTAPPALFRSCLQRDLCSLSFPGWGEVGKNAPSDPTALRRFSGSLVSGV